MNNYEIFLQIIEEKWLNITHLARCIYLLENKQVKLLVTRKTSASVIGDLYIGWHIFSELYWWDELDEDDLIELSQTFIEQFPVFGLTN